MIQTQQPLIVIQKTVLDKKNKNALQKYLKNYPKKVATVCFQTITQP